MQRNPRIPDRAPKDEELFVTWDDKDPNSRKMALAAAAQASQDYGIIAARDHTVGSTVFMNAGPNVSVRDGISRRDWEYFRPEESVPRSLRSALVACIQAYYRMGTIKNVIDLMGEFTCQGIKLVHPNPGIEKIFQEWAKKIGLHERAERFCNQLYRTGNVIVQRETAMIREGDIDNLRRGVATDELRDVMPPPKFRKNEIPYSYTYINPLMLDVIGGEDLASFTGVALYGLKIPEQVYAKIKHPKTPEERYLVSQLPDYIVSAVNNGKRIIQLDPNKVKTFFYKKDDWEIWARPLLFGIIDDLILFNKMRLADLSALDGAISHIRLWRLGNLEFKIIPKAAAIQKLANVLMNNTAVGAIDLIWGPELDFKETSTDVYRFLGSQKYGQVMRNIYDGLGIPCPQQSDSEASGMGSFLSLKVMIERLKYGRRILNSFLEPEIVMFQQALGIRVPAQIQYDFMVLTDENAYLNLLIQLVDRDLISASSVQEAFGRNPLVEEALIRREHRQRESGKRKPKAGPYHSPEVEDDMLKLFIQQGVVTPGQCGIELDDSNPGEKTALQLKLDAAKQTAKMKQTAGPMGNIGNQPVQKGQPGQGRPPNTRDTAPRKPRNNLKPVKAADEFLAIRTWAREVQGDISDTVTPIFLESCGKDTARKLTEEEFKKLEEFKFAVLCNLQPYSQFNLDTLDSMLQDSLPIPPLANELLNATIGKCVEKLNRQPTVDEIRLLQAEVYSLMEAANFNDDEE